MAKRGRKTRSKAGYMISAVSEMYDIHPQTLRLYEREGLLTPSRSVGNTRLYTQEDLETLETILKLTRDLGVNLAGVQIIMGMKKQMAEMGRQMEAFVRFVETDLVRKAPQPSSPTAEGLVHVGSPYLVRLRSTRNRREG
jgi:MerR family transcriptional regulator, heat shock protein HspR